MPIHTTCSTRVDSQRCTVALSLPMAAASDVCVYGRERPSRAAASRRASSTHHPGLSSGWNITTVCIAADDSAVDSTRIYGLRNKTVSFLRLTLGRKMRHKARHWLSEGGFFVTHITPKICSFGVSQSQPVSPSASQCLPVSPRLSQCQPVPNPNKSAGLQWLTLNAFPVPMVRAVAREGGLHAGL